MWIVLVYRPELRASFPNQTDEIPEFAGIEVFGTYPTEEAASAAITIHQIDPANDKHKFMVEEV